MAAYGRYPGLADMLKRVMPKSGFAVANQGGIATAPFVAPKPAVRQPAVAAGPPGPAASSRPAQPSRLAEILKKARASVAIADQSRLDPTRVRAEVGAARRGRALRASLNRLGRRRV